EIHGTIGNGTAGAADVDWYRFTLTQATTVTLTGTPLAGQAGPVLSLYNNDPNNALDLYDPLGHRLLAQAVGVADGGTTLTGALGPGPYFVAASGAGNQLFHPFMEASGHPEPQGTYQLSPTGT